MEWESSEDPPRVMTLFLTNKHHLEQLVGLPGRGVRRHSFRPGLSRRPAFAFTDLWMSTDRFSFSYPPSAQHESRAPHRHERASSSP